MMFNNIKTWYNGVLYDSKEEAAFAETLDWMKAEGYITKWEPHVKYPLFNNGEHDCDHYPDFVIYFPDGRKEVREWKGQETERWHYKADLFVQNYPDIPYFVVKKGKPYNVYRYTPQGMVYYNPPEPPKKWSKIEIFLAKQLHRIGSLIK